VLELGAGNQRVNIEIGPDLGKCLELIVEGQHLMPARFQHASDDQPGRAAGID